MPLFQVNIFFSLDNKIVPHFKHILTPNTHAIHLQKNYKVSEHEDGLIYAVILFLFSDV